MKIYSLNYDKMIFIREFYKKGRAFVNIFIKFVYIFIKDNRNSPGFFSSAYSDLFKILIRNCLVNISGLHCNRNTVNRIGPLHKNC